MYDKQREEEDEEKRRRRRFCAYWQCCSSLSPLVNGLILGALFGGLILAVIITLWLTSANKISTTTIMNISTATSITYHNVRHIVRRQLPIVRRKLDKQITAMVLMRVIVFVCLLLPYITYRIYAVNFPTSRSMPMAYAISRLIQAIITSIYIINFAINFYIFIIFSPRFRRQVKLVLVKKCWQRWKYWCCSINNRIDPGNNIEPCNSQTESDGNI
ncbi:unnamed protein product [Adineta steineri]|uniref:G-protein coupled receptors family 1 profile domain-containing protein n=1 Tax=Adineta steineri TaxID=433720 RepID=A0A814W368_9BILA|nr:unnamed protein product [Adineta steineri]